MIPRTLVPKDVRPAKDGDAQKPPRRLSTYMDDRTVVPTELSDAAPLDGKTSIPSHLPLDVLVNRTLVPRGLPAKRIERPEHVSDTFPLEVLGSRTVVPAHVEPLAPDEIKEPERAPEMTRELREIVEPDIFNTGDANLLMEPEDKRDPRADLATRIVSIAVHVGLIVFLISIPKLFPPHTPTQQEIDLAKRELTYLLPPEPKGPPIPPAPTPKVRISPDTLNRVAPPIEQPALPPVPQQNPMKAPSSLPQAPTANLTPNQPAPSQLEPIRPAQQNPKLNLDLPQASPGKMLQDQLDNAVRHGAGNSGIYRASPPAGGGGGPHGGPGMGNGAQILSDTQGVDFNPYIQRLLATLKRNWMAVMPESALMGDKGMVFTTFQINPDGSVAPPDPILERTSGKDALDNAAMSAIHASNPFEPLPSQFHGPYLRLRIVFIYNIPQDQWNFQ
ncbi:MAG: TonB C-terminal domain-containing protein [Candidatus Acidiferrales bacterium]